jgi:hypothetical protein
MPISELTARSVWRRSLCRGVKDGTLVPSSPSERKEGRDL